MNPFLRLGIELPPVPTAATDHIDASPGRPVGLGADIEGWWQMAAAGAAAGAGTVWVTGGPPMGDAPGHDVTWCDACTLAGSLASRLDGVLLGVVSPLPGGRHPSVLARDVTTLDVLSAGRAAVQVHWDAPPPTDLAVACEQLGDAVAVCVAMLRGGDPSYDGRYFRISGALNRPAPRQIGGPPVVVAAPLEVGAALCAEGGRRDDVVALARRMVVHADAVVCSADPVTIAAWRAVLDGRRPDDPDGEGGDGEGGDGRAPALLCTVTPADLRTPPARPAMAAARDAGADGVVLAVPARRRSGSDDRRSAPDGEQLAELAAEIFTPWAPTPT